MELLAAGASDHASWQEERNVYSDHVQLDPCHGLCGPLGTLHPSPVKSRCDRLCRPLCLYRVCPRCSARCGLRVGAQSIPLRPSTEPGILFQGSTGSSPWPYSGRPASIEILRSRNGPGTEPEHGGELPHL